LTSRKGWLHLRPSEWVLVAFFSFITAITPFFPNRPNLGLRPLFELIAVTAVLATLAKFEQGRWTRLVGTIRDWLPILLTLLAFREMELFLPLSFDGRLESEWIRLDRALLDGYHLRAAVESLGPVIPFYLEMCYLLVYGVGPICVGILYRSGKRALVDRFWVVYLTGTLLAYALFPYFPSQPPRIVFPGLDNPHVLTWARQLNLFILNKATIHVGVFPSAHVSSAFACAWAMFLLLPQRKRVGWVLVLYAVSVGVATVYGRYHYMADVIAGFGISLASGALAILFAKTKKMGRQLLARGPEKDQLLICLFFD
jgi:membrane-associated phospholipid phosphatase